MQWKLCFYGPHATRIKRLVCAECLQFTEMVLFVQLGQVPIYVLPHPRNVKLLRCLVRGILGNRFAKIVLDSTVDVQYLSTNVV